MTDHANRGVPELLRSLVAALPAEGREAAAARLLGSLRTLAVTVALPGRDGGTVLCRESLVLDGHARALIQAVPSGFWPAAARRLMSLRDGPGARLADAAWGHLAAGRISTGTYRGLVDAARRAA